MNHIAGAILGLCAVGAMIATEVLREVVNRRRVRERGVGGTQDIAIWGILVAAMLFLGALACFVVEAVR